MKLPLPTTPSSSNSSYVYYSVEGDDKTDCDESIGLAALILIIFSSFCCCCSCVAGISFFCYSIFENKKQRIAVQDNGIHDYSNAHTVSSQNQFGTAVSSQNQFGTAVSSQNHFATAVSSQNQFGNVNYNHANGGGSSGIEPQFANTTSPQYLQHQPMVTATQALPQHSSEQCTYVTATQSRSDYRLANYSV